MLNIRFNFISIIEILLVLYFIFGALEIESIKHIDYFLSLFIQFLTISFILLNKNFVILRIKVLILYITNIFIIIFLFLNFLIGNFELSSSINRILVLLSIFGLIIVLSICDFIDINRVIKRTIYCYFILGLVIIIDAIFYLVLKVSLWPPDIYLGLRFSGPFYDSNFLGLFFGVFFILTIYSSEKFLLNKKFILIVFLINLLISLSWTSIIFFVISIFIGYLYKYKNILWKQIIILFIYLIFIQFFSINIDYIKSIFINILSIILPFSIDQLNAKFLSFQYRVDSQLKALELINEKPFGWGPHSIVPMIGRDVHNSYIGFLFELGILGLLLIFINVIFKLPSSQKHLSILVTYIILMALTLNVHYSTVFSITMLLLINAHYVKNNCL